MSLYQCEHCGCCENTALGMQPRSPTKWFSWFGIEDREGKHLCSACMPSKYSDGTPTEGGAWHHQFDRVFLPLGMFKTNKVGNLEHVETGDENFRAYALDRRDAAKACAVDDKDGVMRGIFDGLVQGLINIGVAIGLAIAVIGYAVFSIAKHITIGWH